jgi:hypothetical protein
MNITPVRRALLGLAPLAAVPAVLAASNAGATAPPSSPPPSVPEDTTAPPPGGPTDAAQPAAGQTVPDGYVELVDDTGLLTMVVPVTWADVDTAPASNVDGGARPWISAAPDFAQFQETFDVPGVAYTAFPYEADPQVLIDEFTLTEGCESIEVEPYDDGVVTGLVQVGTSCGSSGDATWNMVAASPADGSFTALVQLQTATAADQEAFDTVLRTFNYTPSGPSAPGSSVPGSVPGGLPADNTPLGVAQAYVTAVQTDDAAAACALLGPTVLAEIAENEGSCEEQFLAGNDADDPSVATMQVVGEATTESGICEPASAEGTAVVEVVGDDAGCIQLVETNGQWLIDGFEEATPV